MTPPRRSPVVSLALGLLVLLAALGVAAFVLPEGQVGALPPREDFIERQSALAQRQGVELLPGTPRLRLVSSRQENPAAYERLGSRAPTWLVAHGRGVQVEVAQSARWGGSLGVLAIDFTSRAEPWVASWIPQTVADYFGWRAGQPEGICGLLLGSNETAGVGIGGVSGMAPQTVTPIVAAPGTGPRMAEHLFRLDPPGGSLLCARRPGSAEAGADQLEGGFYDTAMLVAPKALVLVLVGTLFVILALRARIDLANAAVLALVYLLSSVVGDWPLSQVAAVIQGVMTTGIALWLLVLWATAESWARVQLSDFSTSLDTLRRGRLGQRGGRALLVGFGAGAALAGGRLLAFAGAVLLPKVAPASSPLQLPLFEAGHHPLRLGVVWVGMLMLALVVTRRLKIGRWRRPAAVLLVAVLVTPVSLAPRPAAMLVSALLTAGLAWVLHRHGLTATLVAAVLAHLLPTAVFAALHPAWLPVTAPVSVLFALLPLVAGFVGIRRGPEVERDPGAVPEFLRREERERRVSYEMDLLARMQLGLLPQSLPRLAGYEVTARSLLATEAGGDLYDFLRDDKGRLWIAAGDVSGHGYSCAIGQASVKASLLSLVDGTATPAKVLARVDRVMRGSATHRQFATLCLCCLEEATGRMLVANAGHPFPLLVSPGVGARDIELPGLPLGQGPPRRYHDVEVVLPRGSVLLIYSDGLYEATDPEGRPYGFERPRQILAEAAAWNAAEVLERLIYDWRSHLAGAAPGDDTTLLVLKRH